jgi:hypothetical protein
MPVRIDRFAVEIEFDNVVDGPVVGRHVASEQKTVRTNVMADADMPESVDDAVIEQDVIG